MTLTTVCAATALLAIFWHWWDAATGRRAERNRRRELCTNKTTLMPGTSTNSNSQNYVN